MAVINQGDARRIVDKFRQMKNGKSVKASVRAMKQTANYVFQQSQQLVPYDTGALHASGRVVQVGIGIDTGFEVTYGGPGVDYALDVHELGPEFAVHGHAYNLKHIIEISQGKLKMREPQEQWHYLVDNVHDIGKLRSIFDRSLVVYA